MANLVLRSAVVLALLFGLVFAVGMMINVWPGMPTSALALYAVFVVFLQYLIGPFIVQWLFTIDWVEPEDLSPELAAFTRRVCAEQGIPLPRFGLIDDGTPNAFTFGHLPRNARLVVTQGILDLLTPEEQQAVVAHELGHIARWDFVIMTWAAGIPLVLYVLADATWRSAGEADDEGAAYLVAVAIANRYSRSPETVHPFLGFRCAKSLAPSAGVAPTPTPDIATATTDAVCVLEPPRLPGERRWM